jgi:hypothetical protein
MEKQEQKQHLIDMIKDAEDLELYKEQTAVEQFAIALYEKGLLKGNGDDIQELLEQFKEIFEQQIIDAWEDSIKADNGYFGTGTHYYNETFKTITN